MKKSKFFAVILLQLSILLAFTACSNGDGSNVQGGTDITNETPNSGATNGTTVSSENVISKRLNLNIADATNLYIGNSTAVSSSRAATDSVKKLFKITEDGYVQEISYTYEVTSEVEYEVPTYDEAGNVTGSKKETKTEVKNETATDIFTPTAILPVNDDYVLVTFDISKNEEYSYAYKTISYLVRKSDGAAFSMENVGNPTHNGNSSGLWNDFKNESHILKDKNGNIYFGIFNDKDLRHEIVKVALSNPDILTSSVCTPSTDFVNGFTVDWYGNIIYKGYLLSNGLNRVYRIRKAKGGLANLGEMNAYWIGLDGNIYYYSNDQSEYKNSEYDSETNSYTYYGYPIKKVTISSDGTLSDEIYGYFNDESAWFNQSSSYKFELNNCIIIVYASGSYSSVYEVYNAEGNPRKVALDSLSLKSITAVSSTENFYYIAGSDSSNNTFLIKVNPTDDSYVHLLPQNDYDVYSFTASENAGIIFNALRMSDGKKVIGKVGIDGGDVTMIDEESDVQISYLERIN